MYTVLHYLLLSSESLHHFFLGCQIRVVFTETLIDNTTDTVLILHLDQQRFLTL